MFRRGELADRLGHDVRGPGGAGAASEGVPLLLDEIPGDQALLGQVGGPGHTVGLAVAAHRGAFLGVGGIDLLAGEAGARVRAARADQVAQPDLRRRQLGDRGRELGFGPHACFFRRHGLVARLPLFEYPLRVGLPAPARGSSFGYPAWLLHWKSGVGCGFFGGRVFEWLGCGEDFVCNNDRTIYMRR